MTPDDSSVPVSTPTRRADATHNREKILEAARSAFAEAVEDVSMAEVSRRAGVGMATLYRNFPGRRELLEAIYADEVTALCEAATGMGSGTPREQFLAWLRQFMTFVTSKNPVASGLLKHSDRDNPVFGDSRSRVVAAGQPLLEAAQSARQIRDDVTLDQILDLVHAIAQIPEDGQYLDTVLRVAFDGLTSRTGQHTQQDD